MEETENNEITKKINCTMVRKLDDKSEKCYKMVIEEGPQNFYGIDCISDNGDTMGIINFYIDDKETFLHFLCTDPSYARLGVASALVETMEYISANNGIKNIRGKFFPLNEFALPFYQKHGYFIPNQENSWGTYDETWTMHKTLDYEKVMQNASSFTFEEDNKEIEM